MEALGIDSRLLLAQAINFILFLIIFKKFINKPFKRYLDREKEAINSQQTARQNAESILVDSKNEAEKIVNDAKQKGNFIVEEAKKIADSKTQQLTAKAKKDIETQKQKLMTEIEQERQKNYRHIKKEIIESSLILSNKVLSDYITENKQQSIIKNLTEKLAKSNKYGN